jgi:hypothetical protein
VVSREPAAIDRTIVAFRAFRERRGELYSLTPAAGGRERWPVRGIVNAACESPLPGQVRHLAPAAGCRCGVYAVDSLATLQRTLAHLWFWLLRAGGRIVTAAVLVWSSPGRPVIVGELRGAPGYQYRAPHMRVLALADSPAARRVAERHQMLVLPVAGLETYAREHGVQLRPGRGEPRAARVAPASAPVPAWIGERLIESLGRRLRPRAPRTWTVGLAVALTLMASVHLSAAVAWRALRLTASVLGWLVPRLMHGLVLALINPIEAVLTVVVGLVLLVAAWTWAADLVKGVVQL